jgi:hypothetical protein
MDHKLFTMLKMTRSCHDIIIWANVHPFYLHTTVTSSKSNTAHIMNNFPTDSILAME